MKQVIVVIIFFVFNISLIWGQEEVKYFLDQYGVHVEKNIENMNQSDSITFSIVNDFIADYYSDDLDKIDTIDISKKEIKVIGAVRVDKNGFFNSDYIRLHYTLIMKIDSNKLNAKFTLNSYFIRDYSAFSSSYTSDRFEYVSHKYPFNKSDDQAKHFNIAFENSLKEITSIFNKIEKAISENNYINEFTAPPPFELNNFVGTYIVNIERDTFPVNIIKHNLSKLKCDSNGFIIKYKAKNIFSFIDNGKIYDSGKVRDKGLAFTRWIFLHKIIDGDLSYYTYVEAEKSISSNGNGQNGNYYKDAYLNFIRLKVDNQGRFRRVNARWRKQFKKLCSDCPSVIKQIKEDGYWGPNLIKYVNIYNENCGAK